VPNPVVHFEIGCRDREKTVAFYQKLFDWTMQPNDIATEIVTAPEHPVTGHIVSLGHEPHHYTQFYVEVQDLSASLEKAESLGGKILVPPIPRPNGGRFAWFRDPEGNTVGLIEA
jgi:predicted enzyme related to lactoylglutathione lyase